MHFYMTGKTAKTLMIGAVAAVMMAGSAFAADADIASSVGATTGTGLRMRAAATTESSIVTTLNKGTAVAVLGDVDNGWYHVRYNGKEGFVSADYLMIDTDNVFKTYGRVNGNAVHVRADATTDSKSVATLKEGTVVTVNGLKDGWFNVTCEYGTKGYIRSDLLDLVNSKQAASNGSGKAASIANSAKQYLGTPYVYGGSSPRGFDCSGFTMYMYGKLGYSLPHSASAQWKSGIGTKVYSSGALQSGDLVFFNDPSRNAGKCCSHAGLYLGGGQFIHASSSRGGGVKISNLNSGYYNRYFVGGIHV